MTAVSNHNVVCLFREAVQRAPTNAAFIDARESDRAVSFTELWDRVARVSVGLQARGIGPDDRLILMIPMSVDLYVVLLAVLKLGAVAVFVDPWIRLRQVAAFATFADPKAFIGIPKSHIYRIFERRLRTLPLTVSTGPVVASFPAQVSLAQLLNSVPAHDIAIRRPHDPALVTFTSGSSGTPKGANRDSQFLESQHRALQHEFPYRDSDIDLSMFPVFALNNLARGITTVIPDISFGEVASVSGPKLLSTFLKHQISTCTASPPLIDALAHQHDRSSTPLPLRRILVGGAPISDEQLEHWRRSFPEVEVQVVYGSTEAEPVAHIEGSERLAITKRSSALGYCVGRVSTLCAAKVVKITRGPLATADEALADIAVPPQEIGELVVSGAHICRDYFRNEAAVRENKIVTPAGEVWHRMGDTGYFDAEGCFWLAGRVHSTVVSRGRVCHAQLIEQVAQRASVEIRRCALLGVPREDVETAPLLLIETKLPADRWDALRQSISTALRNAAMEVDEIVFTGLPLPTDPRHNSKIDYQRAREWFVGRVSPTARYRTRLKAYLDERFPLLAQGLLILSYYSSTQFLAQVLHNCAGPVVYSSASVWGALLVFLIFFHLRVCDEHKDFADDQRNYPDRILSRGVFTLREIRLLGILGVVLQLLIAGARSPAALVALLLTLGYSLLMLKEFFVSEWLKRRFLLYTASHMVIMPFIALTVFSFVTGELPWYAPGWYWLYAFVGLCVTLNWEISRKIRAPQDELEGVESYSSRFGYRRAAQLVLGVRCIDTGLVFLVGAKLGLGPLFFLSLLGLFVLTTVSYKNFVDHPSRKSAKLLEIVAGMYILAFDIILAAAIAERFGVTWNL